MLPAIQRRAADGYQQARDAATLHGTSQAQGGLSQALGGGLKTAWNVSASPLHTVGSGLVGGAKGLFNGHGFLGGMTQGVTSALKTDAADIGQGIKDQGVGAGNVVAGVGQAAAAPVFGAIGAARNVAGYNPVMQMHQKSAFSMLAQPTTAYPPAMSGKKLSNAGGPNLRANSDSMASVNKWIAAGSQAPGNLVLPDRPGTHKRALGDESAKAGPSRIGDGLTTLGSDTPSGKDMQMTGPGSGFANGVPVVDQGGLAPTTPDLTKLFRKYHGTSYNPNSSMDQGKLKQMEEVYREHGKLTPTLVYNRQYGAKSPYHKKSASAFAELEKSAMVGTAVRGLGRFLSRSALSAQKANKTQFQNFYKGLSDAQKAARPELRQRATQYWSSSPEEIGRNFGIGQWRQNLGTKLQNVGEDMGVLAYTNPMASRVIDGGVMLGGGLATAGVANQLRQGAAPVPSSAAGTPPGIDKTASVVGNTLRMIAQPFGRSAQKAIRAGKAQAIRELRGLGGTGLTRQRGRGSRALNEGLQDRQNAFARLQNTTLSEFGRGNNIAQTRVGINRAIESAADSVDNFAKTRPNLYRAGVIGVPTVAGGGALFGANRLGHHAGREEGAAEGYDAAAELAMAAAPEQQGYFGNLWNAVAGNPTTDAAALRNLLDQNKSDMLQTILRGRA